MQLGEQIRVKQDAKASNTAQGSGASGQNGHGGNGSSKQPKQKKPWFIVAAVVVILVLAGLAGFFYWKYTDLRANPDSVAQETTQRLVDKVGNLYELPSGEPTVAQISDKEKLKDQPFFKNARNNDYLLIYTDAKLAILYREEANRLVNVGPIAITPEDGEATPKGTEQTTE